MQVPCTFARGVDGRWSLRHTGTDVGTVVVTADTKQEAVDKMRAELRYRLELCPCSGESYQHLVINIVGSGG